jgi:hydrophobic/amphiphilic exporter-1 (mainly G- bacteria), HAE1 family
MILVKTAVKRPILTTVTVFSLALMGFLSYFNLPLNTIPEVEIPFVTVQVIYPGASPEEIETNVTKKIEDEVYTISGIDFVESYLMENVNITLCKFLTDKDPDIASREVKDKIDAIANEFPSDVQKPVILKFDMNAQAVVQLAFVSGLPEKDAFDYADNELRNRLSRINGVSKVDLSGGRKREIQIILNTNNLSKYMLSPLHVIGFLASNNMSIPGGNIRKNGSEYSVKVAGEFENVADIENLKIKTVYGEKYLRDIAEISDTLEKEATYSAYYLSGENGDVNKKVIKLSVFKQSDANTVNVAKGILSEVKALQNDLPPNSSLVLVQDSSTFIKDSVNDTMSTIYLGIILTALVLYLFLHSFKITMIIAVSMPVTLVSTFLLADWAGFSLNVFTLMALSVSVGTLVTNSVIIIENIIRHMKNGENSAGASYKGTIEIAVAVLASTLTNIVVFVPIASMGSIAGQMFKEFGLMVTFAMIFSIIVGFTVTPMLATVFLRHYKAKSEHKKGFGRFFDKHFDRLTELFRSSLSLVIHNKLLRITAMVLPFILLIGTFYYIAKVSPLGNEFFPKIVDRKVQITIELPNYYSIDKTRTVFEDIRKICLEMKESESALLEIGTLGTKQGGYIGSILVNLYEDKYVERPMGDIITELNAKLSGFPDAKIKLKAKDAFEGPGGESPIVFEIYGDEQNKLSELTYKVLDIVKRVPGTTNVDSDIRQGKPEIRIIPDRKKLLEYGTDASAVAMVVRSSVEGLIGSKLKEGGKEYDIRIRTADSDINDIERIKNILVLTPRGNVKISELADLVFDESPSMITRKNKSRQYKVTADLSSRTTGEVNNDIWAAINSEIAIPPGFKIDTGFNAKIQEEMGREFAKAAFIAILLTFLLIAGILESYRQSFLIMISLPLSLLGVIWSLKLTGIAMNLFAMMAGVMLIGIVVNNAILILDYANLLKKSGQSVIDSIINASAEKLKAVTMATLASVFGMLPLALGLGEGAEMRQGMGVVSMFGLIASAILTLYVIPAFYAAFVSDKHFEDKNGYDVENNKEDDLK